MTAVTPHRRLNLLTGDWVLVSPQRMTRPWQGEDAAPEAGPRFAHDPDCYLCPRNRRSDGIENPDYSGVWVFDNDFPALLDPAAVPGVAEQPEAAAEAGAVLVSAPVTGVCRVMCYSPDHDRTLARMDRPGIEAVVQGWAAQWHELSARPDIAAVTIFENRGAMMGASNPHPHGQIWATSVVPDELAREASRQADWISDRGTALLADVLAHELAEDRRIVWSNDHWVILVPYWAVWPFETLILPRSPVADLGALSRAGQAGLAEAVGQLTRLYDRVFDMPFPYTMGLHQRPCHDPAPGFVMHLHAYPPLLRSATVRKHMVGFEMLAMAQRDLTAEAAADRLRQCSKAVTPW